MDEHERKYGVTTRHTNNKKEMNRRKWKSAKITNKPQNELLLWHNYALNRTVYIELHSTYNSHKYTSKSTKNQQHRKSWHLMSKSLHKTLKLWKFYCDATNCANEQAKWNSQTSRATTNDTYTHTNPWDRKIDMQKLQTIQQTVKSTVEQFSHSLHAYNTLILVKMFLVCCVLHNFLHFIEYANHITEMSDHCI